MRPSASILLGSTVTPTARGQGRFRTDGAGAVIPGTGITASTSLPIRSTRDPAFWLTDYLIATSLQAAYAAQVQANANAAAAALCGSPLSPDVKAQIADEVKYDVQQENLAAQANAANPQAPPPDTGVAALMSDGRPHVFVAGSDLDLVDASGRECMVTQGDVVQVQSAPAPDAVQANAIVLASKGGNECAQAASVTVALTDLQEMQNHMRETIDQGMAELQAKKGKGWLARLTCGRSRTAGGCRVRRRGAAAGCERAS